MQPASLATFMPRREPPRSNIRSSHYFYLLRDTGHELFNDIFSTSGDNECNALRYDWLAGINSDCISCLFNFFHSQLSGNMCMARAYQTADSSWLAPLDFTYLLFAAFWGRVLFDSWPSLYSSIGMILITTAGLITAWREAYHRSKG